MKILLTGATGYIGGQLLPELVREGHHVVALVRDREKFHLQPSLTESVTIIQGDLLKPETLCSIPQDIEVAYYLVHSMRSHSKHFSEMEKCAAENFVQVIERTEARQLIYLSGLSEEKPTSEHMISRHRVEEVLKRGKVPVTIFRAGIIIGKGSASYQIMSDLVMKLPIMIAPRWVFSHCQPIAVQDVLFYLRESIDQPKCLNRTFEIGGPEVLTYYQMMMHLAKAHQLKRWIIPVPVLTPRLSSYWLYFVTSTNFPLAQALVDSLRGDAICRDDSIRSVLPHKCLSYEDAL